MDFLFVVPLGTYPMDATTSLSLSPRSLSGNPAYLAWDTGRIPLLPPLLRSRGGKDPATNPLLLIFYLSPPWALSPRGSTLFLSSSREAPHESKTPHEGVNSAEAVYLSKTLGLNRKTSCLKSKHFPPKSFTQNQLKMPPLFSWFRIGNQAGFFDYLCGKAKCKR